MRRGKTAEGFYGGFWCGPCGGDRHISEGGRTLVSRCQSCYGTGYIPIPFRDVLGRRFDGGLEEVR